MATTGTAIVDFGAFPGAAYATVDVTGQTGILSGSLVEAEIYVSASADHTADEHAIDPPRIQAGAVTAGVGFPIHAFTTNNYFTWGKWNVYWVGNY